MESYRILFLVQKSINIELGKKKITPNDYHVFFLIIILKDTLLEVASLLFQQYHIVFIKPQLLNKETAWGSQLSEYPQKITRSIL